MDQLFFERKSVGRDSYYCEYLPPVSQNRFATVNITFPRPVSEEEATKICEEELELWIKKYEVPLMLSAWDAKANMIPLVPPYNDNYLVGWLNKTNSKVEMSGNSNDLDEFLKTDVSSTDWARIYPDFNHRTQLQVNERAETFVKTRVRDIRILKIIFVAWFAVIPASWAIYQYLGPEWLEGIVALYACYRSAIKGLEIWGYKKPKASDVRKAVEEREKDHHHYHCKQNPIGFLSLKRENFEREAALKIQEEAKNLGVKIEPTK